MYIYMYDASIYGTDTANNRSIKLNYHLIFCLPDFFSVTFFSEVLSTSMSCSFQSLLFTLFRLLNHNFPLVLYEKCVCKGKSS